LREAEIAEEYRQAYARQVNPEQQREEDDVDEFLAAANRSFFHWFDRREAESA
jgi:hypothetical protein